MQHILNNNNGAAVDFAIAEKIIANHPFFVLLLPQDVAELAQLLTTIQVAPQEVIVKENDPIDCLYMIVSGTATVTKTSHKIDDDCDSSPLGVLGAGEAIGISNDGFFSMNNRRTATIIADSAMCLLRLSIENFEEFIRKKSRIYPAVYLAVEKILRINFLKKLPIFSTLQSEEVEWLIDNIEEKTIPAQTILFNQGDAACAYFLVKKGKLITYAANDAQATTTTFVSPQILAIDALAAAGKYVVTAKAVTDSDLLIIHDDLLNHLPQLRSINFTKMINTQSIPAPLDTIKIDKHFITNDLPVFILVNSNNQKILRLHDVEWKIWNLINGKNSIAQISATYLLEHGGNKNNFLRQLKKFLLVLDELGFVTGLVIKKTNKWVRLFNWPRPKHFI